MPGIGLEICGILRILRNKTTLYDGETNCRMQSIKVRDNCQIIHVKYIVPFLVCMVSSCATNYLLIFHISDGLHIVGGM